MSKGTYLHRSECLYLQYNISMNDEQTPIKDQAPTLWQMIKSVNASFFGVQSKANRERDFKHGKASHFIIIGILMTLVFIGGVVLAVKFALHQAGL